MAADLRKRDDASIDRSSEGYGSGAIFVTLACALSGAVMGFLFTGAIKLSAAVFLAGIAGLVAGWWACKLAQPHA